MPVKFGKVHRSLSPGKPNMNDFSVVTVSSPLELFEKVVFSDFDAEFPSPHKENDKISIRRIQLKEDDDQDCETVRGDLEGEGETIEVDICREKSSVEHDSKRLVLDVADDAKAAPSIEQAVGKLRKDWPGPVQLVQCELGDGRILCARIGTFVMPCCEDYRGFVCLNINNVCVVNPQLGA